MTSVALFRRLLSYSLPYWLSFLIAVLGMAVTATTEAAFPALMKQLLDRGFQGVTAFAVWWVPIVILGIFVVRGVGTFTAAYCMEWLANNVLRDIRQTMFDRIVTLPASSFDAKSTGQLISKMISEAQQVLSASTNVVTVLIRDTLVLVGLLAWLLWINWKLTFVVLLMMPILALLIRKFSTRLRSVGKSYLKEIGGMTVAVEEVISGNRVVKIYGGEDYEKKRFRIINSQFRSQAMRYAITAGLQTPISQLIAALGVSVVVTVALVQTRTGEATAGDFISFVTAMLLMLGPLKHLAEMNASLQRGLAAAEGVFNLLDEASERDSGSKAVGRSKGQIVFSNVTMQYPSRDNPALKSVSIEILAGKTYAFVGPSGSGKSTFVNLIPRLYEVDDGSITLDGIDIKDLKLKSLRSQIALVSQDVVLFNDTISKNIAYGRSDLNDSAIREAANAADLLAFVDSLPLGMQTVVGDRGVRLSGGQRQRIAIARAILKDAPILILDEATSALDTQSESNVQNAIEKLKNNRTTVVVAHRLTTVVNADQIVVMDKGQIVQLGTHSELIRVPGMYQLLYAKMRESN